MRTYQLPPPDITVVSEILSEIEVFHELKYESERVLLCRVYPNEWYHALSRETSVRQCFMAKPLSVGSR